MPFPFLVALLLAITLWLLGLVTGWAQWRGLKKLAARKHVPSDEAHYLRQRYRRRLLTAGLFCLIGTMIAAAYLSGMERIVDDLKPDPAPPSPVLEGASERATATPPSMTAAQKGVVRLWAFYWIGIVILVFGITGLAMVDVLATRQYWYGRYRELRDEHQARLRRDLAVYRQQKEQSRAAKLGPLPPLGPSTPPDED